MSDPVYQYTPNLANVTEGEIEFVEAVRQAANHDFGPGRVLGVELDLLLARYNDRVTSAELLGALHLMVQKTEWAIQNSLYQQDQQKRINVAIARMQEESMDQAGLGSPLQ